MQIVISSDAADLTSRARQPLTTAEIAAVCRRAFGADTRVTDAIELGLGTYNSTYRLTLAGHQRPVVLRVAPEESRQFASERHFMRNEHATLPWLAPIAALLPSVLAADWTHDVIDRDWMIQTWLDGLPAPDGLARYPRDEWGSYFRELGAITRSVHAVQGPSFGPIVGPGFATWSDALLDSLTTIADDVETVGLSAADLRLVIVHATARRAILDEVREPRLLPGDLWTANVMLTDGARQPTICGLMDLDRAIWGDPAADWTIYVALANESPERAEFWGSDGYGGRPSASPDALWRSRIYTARHIGAVRVESARVDNADAVDRTYDDLTELLAGLPAEGSGPQ
jgi:aminoglycoside phosphotransferase (APT) family kinase protein